MRIHVRFVLTLTGALLIGVTCLAGPAQAAGGATAPVQLWNSDLRETVYVGKYFGPNFKKLEPITIVGTRNGVFSGRIVATCATGPMHEVSAGAGALKAEGGAEILAGAVEVRYQLPGGETDWAPSNRFAALVEKAPDPVKLIKFRYKQAGMQMEGAVSTLPIFVTVRIPADAEPGTYSGTLTVSARGIDDHAVPIRLTVYGLTLPDPVDFVTAQLGFHSPETVARMYDIEMWSEKHLEYLGREFELMAELNSRRVEVNLVAGTYAHLTKKTWVPFIRQPDGGYRYDFSNLDKYFTTIKEAIGEPNPLRINIWDVRVAKGRGPQPVTVIDPKTGESEQVAQPEFGSEASRAFWKPVLDKLRPRLKKLGWLKVTAFGDTQYAGVPKPPMVDMIHDLWGKDGQWYMTQHGLSKKCKGTEGVVMPINYGETVWREGKASARGYKALKRPPRSIYTSYARNRHYEKFPLFVYRALPEEMTMRGRQGVGPLGMDCWPLRNEKGRLYRAGGGALGAGASTKAVLAAGPDGPVATEWFEAMREGIQLTEAILFIQHALDAKKIDGELAMAADKLLQERGDHFMKCLGMRDHPKKIGYIKPLSEGSAERDEALLKMAARVQAVVERKEAQK
ncbi:MAG: hypothetical protein R6V58_12975 [Planctomycetota bacterium]